MQLLSEGEIMFDPIAFEMTAHIFEDAYALKIRHFASLDCDLHPLDYQVRGALNNEQILYDNLREKIMSINSGEILTVHDSLLLHYQFMLDDHTPNGFFCIGPYMPIYPEQNKLDSLANLYHMNFSTAKDLEARLLNIPTQINDLETLCIARNMMLTFYGIDHPILKSVELVHTDLDERPLAPEETPAEHARKVQTTYIHEDKILSYIRDGDDAKAVNEAKYFMTLNFAPDRLPSDMVSHRALGYSANTLYRKACQQNGILPVTLDDISHHYAKKISQCTTHQQIDDLLLDMVRSYCKLCRDHKTEKYSHDVQMIMQYILVNLNTDLRIEDIAACVNFSPNYTSHLFRKETGKSITAYITEERLSLSKRLLLESPMNVKSIANYIGIPDWNYFIKLFKKDTGMTPTAWRDEQKEKEKKIKATIKAEKK
jgi:two-component system response regulator YesN